MSNIYPHVFAPVIVFTLLNSIATAAPPATTPALEQRLIDLAPLLSAKNPATQTLDVQMFVIMGQTCA